MKVVTLLIAVALLGCEAQAQRQNSSNSSSRGSDSSKTPGCSVKVNDVKVISRDAVDNMPVEVDTTQFQMNFLFQSGRLFQASLKDKQTGDQVELANSSGGALTAKLATVSGENLLLNLPTNLPEISATTTKGDWLKLERDSKNNLLEGEVYWRASTQPQTEINFSCDY